LNGARNLDAFVLFTGIEDGMAIAALEASGIGAGVQRRSAGGTIVHCGFPHSGQNLAMAVIGLPQSMQNFVSVAAAGPLEEAAG
jgi:hypothetical protein